MQRLILSSLIAVGLIAAAMSAEAGGYKHRGKGYGGSGHYGKHYRQGRQTHYRHRGHYGIHRRHGRQTHYRHNGHDYDDDFYTALGITAGIGLLGVILSQPRYIAPAPTYYAPPPRRECYEQNVYRYLPDGRIQWGVKRTCN